MTRIGSLFSGYGGLDMAVQTVLVGDVVWYSEIEPAACKVLAAHHQGVPNLGDITKVDWATVPPIDVLTGGYPCQPFSHAGKRAGTNDERHLWPYVRDAIVALRPMVTVLENVDGHRSLGLDVVLGDLADLGLSARWGVVRASDAGAPHGRKRVFIVVTDPDGPGLEGHLGWASSSQATRRGHAESGSALPADADGHGHGRELHARGMAGVEGQATGSAPERQRARGESDAGGDLAAADAQGDEQREPAEPPAVRPQPRDGADARAVRVDWGKYAPAIHRWESVLGRPAPAPTIPGANGRPRLSPVFVEWMMGLPAGHVTGHGLRPAQELKMLGNGVVPQQARLALDHLAGAA